MKLDIGGSEIIQAPIEALWQALNDPAVLTRCVPGCKSMTETSPDAYKLEMQLKVAAVGGSFEGEISLSDKDAPKSCRIKVSGAGTLGHGNGEARFDLAPEAGGTKLTYQGAGEVGGLVAGVGQRILGSVSKILIGKFFTSLRKEFEGQASTVQAAGAAE
ncbi:MAG TPA: carbon monoxide dehydrogenase subunit G [Stellaceae bacterium]|jgi:carbon monoxide dehydrogenase subunit G|nr:carbon monoxide dehydrogenase subunit G [Stellaceae bacterium]